MKKHTFIKFRRVYELCLFLALAFTALPVRAQSLIFDKELGEFKNAGAFSFSKLNVIYVTDLSSNEVYMLSPEGKVLNFIGGYGRNNTTFDMPVDVFSNTLNVYVTDKNNDRVQIFDKDLNYLSGFKSDETDEYTFAYPLGAEVSPLGDLFILDSDNSRILKFNLTGDFQQVIGDYQSGSYTLEEPTKFAIGPSGKIYVLSQNNLVVFDQFGAGLYQREALPEPVNVNITNNKLCINNKTTVAVLTLGRDSEFTVFTPELYSDIVEAAVLKDRLYVLTASSILVYRIVE